MRVLSMFAGASGIDIAAHALGHEVDGWELDPVVVQTREVNGLRTVGRDVTQIVGLRDTYEIHAAGPPCPPFSIAGKGAGRLDLDLVRSFAPRYAGPRREAAIVELAARVIDPRTALVLEPLRLAYEGRPPYLFWEQVPPVIHVWDACKPVLEALGYSVATGVIASEQYGAPQRRERAILLARADGAPARLPRPLRAAYGQPYGSGTLPRWLSMSEIGWGMTDRPSYAVTAGGTGSGGGLEVFGNGARRGLRAEYEAGRWLDDGVDRWSSTGKSIRLTTADVLALQTFPADFRVVGRIGQRTHTIGNAVPPAVAFACLDELTS